jgi:hypothetical protein
MANKTYKGVSLLLYRKLTVFHPEFNIEAVCEVKIWQLAESQKYPFGFKYSLFCVNKITKKIVVGFDNHFPKGPHIHIGNNEVPYIFMGHEKLIDDFWDAVIARGFII